MALLSVMNSHNTGFTSHGSHLGQEWAVTGTETPGLEGAWPGPSNFSREAFTPVRRAAGCQSGLVREGQRVLSPGTEPKVTWAPCSTIHGPQSPRVWLARAQVLVLLPSLEDQSLVPDLRRAKVTLRGYPMQNRNRNLF